mmetsp:Transcript_15467/g.39917  ORF Transcript_15467/g.39917 Transcript_15467/m.39917 type:complete len:181 (-) Transcript_15467:1242-1784(-)
MTPSAARLVRLLVASMAAMAHAGTDGAMAMFYEQQLEPGNLEDFKGELPIGVDVMGKLVPTVLKVGHLAHRGKPVGASHYHEILRWLKNLLSFTGVTYVPVFDCLGCKYPPKAARAGAQREEQEQKNRAEAKRRDDAHTLREDPEADKLWNRIVHRPTLRDLVAFTIQLCDLCDLHWYDL